MHINGSPYDVKILYKMYPPRNLSKTEIDAVNLGLKFVIGIRKGDTIDNIGTTK